MDLVHFTPGSIGHDTARTPGAAAIMPLANGKGDVEISCLYLPPRGWVSVLLSDHSQLILTVNGKASATFPTGFGPKIYAGMGMLLHAGETCRLDSVLGAVIIAIEATKLEADLCGISLPDRVMGQQWPSFESN
jgi:hypothetical protein